MRNYTRACSSFPESWCSPFTLLFFGFVSLNHLPIFRESSPLLNGIFSSSQYVCQTLQQIRPGIFRSFSCHLFHLIICPQTLMRSFRELLDHLVVVIDGMGLFDVLTQANEGGYKTSLFRNRTGSYTSMGYNIQTIAHTLKGIDINLSKVNSTEYKVSIQPTIAQHQSVRGHQYPHTVGHQFLARTCTKMSFLCCRCQR